MKNKLVIASAVLAALGLGGCASRYADVPAPTRFENSDQLKIQAAHHWHLIAENAAGDIAKDLKDKLNGRAIYVPEPGNEQPFVQGFRELLTTALVAQGLPVSTVAQNALTVDVRYSIYRFSPDRAKNAYYYGDATMLAAGLWAVGGLATAEIFPGRGINAGAKLLTLAAGLDGFSWLANEQMGRGKNALGQVPRAEILLTASVVDGTRIISRRTNIYYAADEDSALYWNKGSSDASTLPVVGELGKGGK